MRATRKVNIHKGKGIDGAAGTERLLATARLLATQVIHPTILALYDGMAPT
jgi:hypothetical protein